MRELMDPSIVHLYSVCTRRTMRRPRPRTISHQTCWRSCLPATPNPPSAGSTIASICISGFASLTCRCTSKHAKSTSSSATWVTALSLIFCACYCVASVATDWSKVQPHSCIYSVSYIIYDAVPPYLTCIFYCSILYSARSFYIITWRLFLYPVTSSAFIISLFINTLKSQGNHIECCVS